MNLEYYFRSHFGKVIYNRLGGRSGKYSTRVESSKADNEHELVELVDKVCMMSREQDLVHNDGLPRCVLG